MKRDVDGQGNKERTVVDVSIIKLLIKSTLMNRRVTSSVKWPKSSMQNSSVSDIKRVLFVALMNVVGEALLGKESVKGF